MRILSVPYVRKETFVPRPVVVGFTILIATMWAANLIIGYFYPDRSDPAVNAIFALAAGAVFGLHRRIRNNADRANDEDASRGDQP